MPSMFPSPAADYVESRINLNTVCNFGWPSSRLVIAERSHGIHIISGTRIVLDISKKPVHGNLLIAQINGEMDVWRLVTYPKRGLESLVDNGVFDDNPCM